MGDVDDDTTHTSGSDCSDPAEM